MAGTRMVPQPETNPDSPAHTPAVRKGEEASSRPHARKRMARGPRTSRDATSINAAKRAPIDPRMPNMPPA